MKINTLIKNKKINTLPAVSFQFLYSKNNNKGYYTEYVSKKKTKIEAMCDFLKRNHNIYDINEEIVINYNSKKEIIHVDVCQDWDMSCYFIFENKMIFENGYIKNYKI